MIIDGFPVGKVVFKQMLKAGYPANKIIVPAGHNYYHLLGDFSYTANATASDRWACLSFVIDSLPYQLGRFKIVASESIDYLIGALAPIIANFHAGGVLLPYPLLLPGGTAFTVVILNAIAGDVWEWDTYLLDVAV